MSAGALVAAGADVPPATDYRSLAAEVRAAGLMERRPGWYLTVMVITAVALASGSAAAFALRGSWAVLGVAAFLGLASVHAVFVGHDAGHQQIFGSPRSNRVVGLVAGNVLTGLSFGWWVPKHNAHHAHPNQMGRDPDIGAGVIAFTPDVARTRRGPVGRLVRYQAWAFFPLLTLEGMALRVAGVRALLARGPRRGATEGGLLLAHAGLYLAAVFWLLPPGRALAFIAVQQGFFGLYLGCSFAPNHKGMAIIDRDSAEPFVIRQILTSRNIAGGRLVATAYGGLNFQIEHHLFPSMPRPNLVRAQPVVRRFCAAHGLTYESCGLTESYRRALSYLHAVGSEAIGSR